MKNALEKNGESFGKEKENHEMNGYSRSLDTPEEKYLETEGREAYRALEVGVGGR